MRHVFKAIAALSAAIEAFLGLTLTIPSVAGAVWGWCPEPLAGALHSSEPAAIYIRLLIAAGFLLAALLQLIALMWFADDREEAHTVFNVYGGFLVVAGVCLFLATGGDGLSWVILLGGSLRGALLTLISLVVLHRPDTLSELRLPIERPGAKRPGGPSSGVRGRSDRSRATHRSGGSRSRGEAPRRGGQDRSRSSSGRPRGTGRAEGRPARDPKRTESGGERRRRPRRGRRPRKGESAVTRTEEVQTLAKEAPEGDRAREPVQPTRDRSRRPERSPLQAKDSTADGETSSSQENGAPRRQERGSRQRGRASRRKDRTSQQSRHSSRPDVNAPRGTEAQPPAVPTGGVRPPWRPTGGDPSSLGGQSSEAAESDADRSSGSTGEAESTAVPMEMGRKPRRGRSSTGASFRPRPKRVRRPLWGDAGGPPRRGQDHPEERSNDSEE